MTDLFIVDKQQCRCRTGEHEEHFEEEPQPVEADHAAECGDRLTGLSKKEADDHRGQQSAGGQPAHITALLLLPEGLDHQHEHAQDEDQNLG